MGESPNVVKTITKQITDFQCKQISKFIEYN